MKRWDRLSTVASFYLQGSYTAWASTAFGQGELLVAGGKLQRRTVARGSHGVHQSLRQFGLFVKELSV